MKTSWCFVQRFFKKLKKKTQQIQMFRFLTQIWPRTKEEYFPTQSYMNRIYLDICIWTYIMCTCIPKVTLNLSACTCKERQTLFIWKDWLCIINGILLPKLFWPTVRKNCSKWSRKNFEIWGWRARICKIFEITRTIYSNSERSEQFLVTECFFNLFQEISHV